MHGFCYSHNSWKVRLFADDLSARGQEERLFCPALSHVPFQAIAQAEAIIAKRGEKLTLAGSSLGGYYATHLVEEYDLRAALIDPAVVAPISLNKYIDIGLQETLHTKESFEFTEEHIKQLKPLEAAHVSPERYFLMVETGDEVLDYRQAVARYAGCQQIVLEGGDHSFTRFQEKLRQLLEFFGL